MKNAGKSSERCAYSLRTSPQLALTLALGLLLGQSFSTYTELKAEAFWPFSKSNKASGKKSRELKGTAVGLVPGNPPAIYWAPKNKAKAAVLCLHELGLYKGVFDDLGSRLAKNDYAVYAIDLRGFGGWKDMDKKDAKMSLPKTLQDVKGSCEEIHKLQPDVPVFILGEAMGGALALQAATKFPDLIKGVISAAPGGEHYKSMNNYVSVAGGMAVGSKHAFGLGQELLSMATAKEDLKDALEADEMVRMDVTSGEMMACQFFMYKTEKMAKQIKEMPVLIVHGQKDGESKLSGSQAVYDKLGTQDKKFTVIDDGDHYTFEDTKVSDKAFDTALSWIDQHLAQK